MMQRVLAGALVLVPSADGAVIGLCTNTDTLVFAAACGKVVDSVGSVLSLDGSLSGLAIEIGLTQRCNYAPSDERVDVALAAKLGILSTHLCTAAPGRQSSRGADTRLKQGLCFRCSRRIELGWTRSLCFERD